MADKKDKAEKTTEKKPKKAPEGKPEGKADAKGTKGGGKGEAKGGKGGGGSKSSEDKGEKAKKVVSTTQAVAPRFAEKYEKQVVPVLTKQFGYKNPNQVPRLQKIVVNMGLGAAVTNPKIIDTAVEELRAITGQKPIVTRAKKAIANFKLPRGSPSVRS